jgi:hypothetical protein
MKAYVATTGTIFGLIVLAHIARVAAEGPQLAQDPFFILITLAATGLALWAGCLLWNSRRKL